MPTIRVSSLLDRNVLATDGDVGTLYDIYFSDDTWQVEHLVLQTGPYFKSRRLIMDPGLLLPESGHDGNESSGKFWSPQRGKRFLPVRIIWTIPLFQSRKPWMKRNLGRQK